MGFDVMDISLPSSRKHGGLLLTSGRKRLGANDSRLSLSRSNDDAAREGAAVEGMSEIFLVRGAKIRGVVVVVVERQV